MLTAPVRGRHLRFLQRQEFVFGLGFALVSATTGYLVVTSLVLAAGLAMVPLALYLFTRQRTTGLLLAAAIPYAQDVSAGHLGLNVAASDLLMVLIVVSVVCEAMVAHDWSPFRSLAPLRVALLPYLLGMLLLLAVHLSPPAILKTGQRVELLAFPLLAGAALAARGGTRWFLRLYVLSAALIAVAFPLFVSGDQALGLQKNPAGQFIANALLLMIAVKAARPRLLLPLIPVLIVGLFLTESRGAIVSVGVGLIVLLALQPGKSRQTLVLQLLPLTVFTVVAFRLLPEATQERNTTFTTGTATTAQYALKIRQQYRVDAWNTVHAHPWSGVGVGQYHAGSEALRTISTDPHQVLLFQAAEGGYLFAAAFLVLVLGTALVVIRRARHAPLGPAAAALTLAIASHGLVDVYWVRGTPILGWLVVGMALEQARRTAPTRAGLVLAPV